MPRKLYFRLASVFMLLLAASMWVTTEQAARVSSTSLTTQITQQLVSRAKLVAELVAATGNPAANSSGGYVSAPNVALYGDALAATVAKAGKLTNTRITIINPAGNVVADSVADTHSLGNHSYRPEVKAALAGHVGQQNRYSETMQTHMIYVAVPWYPNKQSQAAHTPWAVRVAIPTQLVTFHAQKVKQSVAWVAALATLLGALLTFFLARRLSQPLTQMTNLVEHMAEGDFHGRIPIRSQDEVGQLARAFNLMATQLDQQVIQVSQRREELERILTTMSDGILAVDSQANLLLLNPAAAGLFGVTAPVGERRPLIETIRHPALITAVRQVLEQNQRYQFELQIYRPVERWIDATVSPVAPGENGNGLVGAIAVLHDVSDLRRLERIRQDFVANVSHELRTPLTAIKGFVETLKDTESPEERASYLSIMDDETDRLVFMVEDLLQLARLESAGTALSIEPENPLSLVQHVVHLLQPKIANKHLSVVVQNTHPRWVLADATLIDQALINLLDNAVKYTPQGGLITISCTNLSDGFVRFNVTDTGPGIERKHVERIFERFYRVDKARSRQLGGTGLGLAIVKHTVERHHGRVGVDSEPGRGSSFWFDLPVAEPNLTTTPSTTSNT